MSDAWENAQSLDPLRWAYLAEATGGQADALAPAAKARLLREIDEALSAEGILFAIFSALAFDNPERIGRDLWRGRNGDPNAFSWVISGPPNEQARMRSAAAIVGPRQIYWAADGQLWSD